MKTTKEPWEITMGECACSEALRPSSSLSLLETLLLLLLLLLLP
jgi:hypothetical protein